MSCDSPKARITISYREKLLAFDSICWKYHWKKLFQIMQTLLRSNVFFNILGDSPNYMPLILVPSSAKRIATQILVIANLNKRKYFILRVFFVISFVPARNYLFKISNLRTRIRFESCSILRMPILRIFNINDVSVLVSF